MKTFMLLIAGAAAMAPPRIELDLSAVAMKNAALHSTVYSNLIKQHVSTTTSQTTHTYDAQGTKIGTKAVTSRQDWSQQCPADKANAQNCPFPVARAYDHNDQDVSVTTNVYLIDFENKAQYNGQALPVKIAASDIFTTFKAKRATYLFKYDAVDQAGNRAEQVVFALILNDLQAPRIGTCYTAKSIQVEAATQRANGQFQFFCDPNAVKSFPPVLGNNARAPTTQSGVAPKAISSKYTALDNIDQQIDSAIRFNIFPVVNSQQSSSASHEKLTLAQVRSSIGTKLGAASPNGVEYVVEAVVYDKAGYYGENGASNKATDELAITITDNTAPKLEIIGANTEYGECCAKGATGCGKETHEGYTDAGARAFDANDGDITAEITTQTGKFIVDKQEFSSDAIKSGNTYTVNLEKVTTKTIFHTVKDRAGNAGVRASTQTKYARRSVEVVDRNAPHIAIKGLDTILLKSTTKNGKQFQNGVNSYVESEDPGVTTRDTCKSDASLSTRTRWVAGDKTCATKSAYKALKTCPTAAGPGDLTKLGQFTREYEVCDRRIGGLNRQGCDGKNLWSAKQHCCADNSHPARAIPCCDAAFRTFDVVDAEAPTIEVMGDKNLIIDASTKDEYTDAGATCTDWVDGVISHAVEVSGEVVNMRRPGKYVMRYDCVDESGKEAEAQFRTVTVVDRTCPQIKIKGVTENYVEAGFAYVDNGFTATDDLDGVISGKGGFAAGKAGCKTDGNTVNVGQAFYDRRSCKAIKTNCLAGQTCGTGEYYISAWDQKANQYKRILVWCNMDSGKTYFPITDAKIAASPLVSGKANDCTGIGMDIATFSNKAEKEAAIDRFCANPTACGFFPDDTQKRKTYLCSTNDESGALHSAGNGAPTGSLTNQKNGAETGDYKIEYYCKDKAGNKDCDWKKGKKVHRNVFVKDTLPPVITLHLRNKLIATGKGNQKGVNNQVNPAGTAAGNPNIKYMAEETTSSVNGWIVGALASAVTGLALLGYSLRKSDNVVTSVPV